MAHHRVVGHARIGQTDDRMGIQKSRRTREILRPRQFDVVVEEKNPLPARQIRDQQPQIPFEAGIDTAFEPSRSEQGVGGELRDEADRKPAHVKSGRANSSSLGCLDSKTGLGTQAAQQEKLRVEISGRSEDVAQADSTPGILASFGISALKKRPASSCLNWLGGKPTRKVSAFDGSIPTFVACNFRKLRSINPAPTSSTSARATSPTTRPFLTR